ncbi:hypothetical protein PsorP6_012787 [Peronosclerospora sorghi]|uniref:Uncharacterized protein n=1 Tax=Peronosclerospora sorghi TaxID=230839 RepID=A0ACC0WIJ0_9STRA|nr:hypothetical protein PsorP6_012787 [Peronosclerospora sorghi]
MWRWIVETATHFAFQRQTAHFSNQYSQVLLRRRVNNAPESYVIGYREDVRHIQRKLRVMGLASVILAAKIEEVHPPKEEDIVAVLAERVDAKTAVEDLSRFEVNLCCARNPSGTKEVFVNAILLANIALLDYQAIDYWPSVLAGAALLLVDPALDFISVAQVMQIDPNVLWEYSSWIYAVTYGVCYMEAITSQAKDRWDRVAAEELMFIQSQVVVPRHLARGLLRPDNVVDLYGAGMTTPLGKPCRVRRRASLVPTTLW